MKKIYLAFALITALSIVSCVENEQFGEEEVNLSENGIAFKFSGVTTKASDAMAPVETKTGISFDVVDKELGVNFHMTENVVDLNSYAPMTKGSPVYHENLLSLKGQGYGQINVKTYLKDGAEHADGNATYDSEDKEGGTGGWLYLHSYPYSPWPNDPSQDVYFFLNMPATSNATDLEYDSSDGSIAFKYTSPATAALQKDILFAARTLNKDQYNGNFKTSGAPVTFYHALTGVKFRTESDNEGTTKTIITKVEFKGLYGDGEAVMNTSTGVVEWTPDSESAGNFSQTFTAPTYSPGYTAEVEDNTVDYVKPEGEGAKPAFGDSWYGKNNTSNLNDDAGSLTFWFVPQAFKNADGTANRDVTLEITFKVCTPSTPNGTELVHEIALGEILGAANVEWKAGQLRTYTLDPKDVDVDIFDTMDSGTDDTGDYLVKENLRVTNTGNVKEFVRLLIMGNWYGWTSQKSMDDGDAPSIIVGYRTANTSDDTMADYWRADHPTYGQGFDSSFTGGKVPSTSKWRRGDGGWYYLDPLGPGSAISAETAPLFEYYRFYDDWTPTLYVPNPETGQRVPAVGVHLVMEVVVQAIGAEDENGEEYGTCWAAWSDATDLTISEKPGYIQ